MAIERLLAALERDAAAEAEALLAAARTEAERLRADETERLARRSAAALAHEGAKLRSAGQRDLAAAKSRARRLVLDARERLLQRVFGAARDRLRRGIGTKAFRRALEQMVADARSYLCDGPVETRRVATGFVLAAADGSVEVDATLEGRLERMRPVLAIEILRRLGKDRGGAG